MNRIYLSLGSNLGDRGNNLENALVQLEKSAGHIMAKSSVYETEPWGCRSELNFYNQAGELHTRQGPLQLLETIHHIEKLCGREPADERFAPRVIDIDILFFNDDILDAKQLVLPHPKLHLRRFVLIPLSEIAPQMIHPVFHKTVIELLQLCQDENSVMQLS